MDEAVGGWRGSGGRSITVAALKRAVRAAGVVRAAGAVRGVVRAAGAAVLVAVVILAGCSKTPEARLREMLASQKTGVLHLPAGIVNLTSELVLAEGSHDLEIVGAGTLLKTAEGFHGRALLVAEGAKNLHLRDFGMDGGRDNLKDPPLEMAPPENAFRVWYPNNGLLFDRVEGLDISHVSFDNVVNFPILVSRSSNVKIASVTVNNSGSLNAHKRNNLSGGILIEEGSSHFEVRDSVFRDIAGNGLWTHSLYTSPRLADGVFAGNRFENIGRDAIQVGHATRVRVEDNNGAKIGYPVEVIDAEHGGTPVAIDTAGNVDQTVYARNHFEEVNGKCFDLDGFHDGAVRDNQCIDRRGPQDYVYGHFGMVMNNTNPDAHSQNIEISGNLIDGMKYGGLFLMGSGNRITGNRFLHLNTAGCNESSGKFTCIYKTDEPKMLESGIYLGRGVARSEETRGNVIRDNVIGGHKMRERCIAAGPGVSIAANMVGSNECSDTEAVK